jgi:hypothetical protein
MDEQAEVSTDERSERIAAFTMFQDEMQARGVLVSGLRLRPTYCSTTVRVRGGDLVIADGPFAETKEQIGGFFLVDCQDLDEAIKVAAAIPIAEYGTVEVRPVWER